ncbi:MAG: hypothetical protein HW380_648 [Magnetococcales bacterium]|nr:hypothetical protein [Magnetococcales bacterium]
MMPTVTTIGSVPWTRTELVEALPEFAELYQQRPIRENMGGMGAPHMFAIWFILKKLKPKAIIESGVWYGQGTWFFEHACPDAQIHCIDINLDRLRYRSPRAYYFNKDFSQLDWTGLPREQTLLFFDDHQNAYERVKTAHWFGFSHLVFEDNYIPGQGDCYSLKQVLAHSGFKRNFGRPKGIKGLMGRELSKIKERLFLAYPVIAPNARDAACLREHLQVYLDEAGSYTWLCYLKLRKQGSHGEF